MAVTADGKTLVVNSRRNSAVYFFSLPALMQIGVADVDGGADWVTLTPDGKTAYVSCTADNAVAVLDIKSMKQVARIAVGQAPKRNITAMLP